MDTSSNKKIASPTETSATTLYFKNLNTRYRPQTLRTHLYNLCSIYGQIISVRASKKSGLRGQAWVVFKEIGQAAAAMQALQSFPFLSKPLVVQYAKTPSKEALEWERLVMGPVRAEAIRKVMQMQKMQEEFKSAMPLHLQVPQAFSASSNLK